MEQAELSFKMALRTWRAILRRWLLPILLVGLPILWAQRASLHEDPYALYKAAALLSAEGKALFVDGSLSELERRLDGERFVRVHRRGLVNLDEVELLAPAESGGFVAHLRGGERVEVSRQAARLLRKRLKI